ncbi:MAG: beta-propeller domain-containing protein [Ruminococcus sp.]|nr:beta-propeller domain-containing protein [Ruminococcus sp.]
MKNDFDFIREQFDSDGVHAPDTINESLVTERLQNVEPVKVKKNKKAVIGIVSASVAGVALVTATAILATSVLGKINLKTPAQPYSTAKLTQFQSRDEVQKAVGEAIKRRDDNLKKEERYYEYALDGSYNGGAASDIAAAGGGETGGSAGGSSSHNSTYVQHTGVDEADNVKTDGAYIYYLNTYSGSPQIEIFRADGKNSKQVADITIDDERFLHEFYVNNGHLVLLSTCYDDSDACTEAQVYDIANPTEPKLLDSFRQSGSYTSSRMIGDTLYMVSTYSIWNEKNLPYVCNDAATKDEVPANCVYAVENPADTNYLVVSSVDTSGGAQVSNTKAVFGSAEDIYCNQEHLYITAGEFEPLVVDGEVWSSYAVRVNRTQLVKIDLTDNLNVAATCYVSGAVNNQYSLDEYEGKLRVATTSSQNGKDVNNLFVLDESLALVGQVTGFAPDESIKAVRYIGTTAYVITYEQTDPLFVIDLSNPSQPDILGAVKISGFSTMLVPVDENTLLGIGYHTAEEDYTDLEVQEGIKLVTFDVSDKANPKVLDTKIFKNYYSEVQYNPRALLVNSERGDYTIPYSTYFDDEGNEKDGGVINFKVQDGSIRIVDEYRSEIFHEKNGRYAEAQRCVYIGNTIYILGNVSTYDAYSSNDHTAIDCVDYK